MTSAHLSGPAQSYYSQLAWTSIALSLQRSFGQVLVRRMDRVLSKLYRRLAAAAEAASQVFWSIDAGDLLRMWVSIRSSADYLEAGGAHGVDRETLQRLRAAQAEAETALREGYGMDLSLPIKDLQALAEEADRRDPREDAALLAAMREVLDDPDEDPEVIREIKMLTGNDRSKK